MRAKHCVKGARRGQQKVGAGGFGGLILRSRMKIGGGHQAACSSKVADNWLAATPEARRL